jgi:hypothetical protein
MSVKSEKIGNNFTIDPKTGKKLFAKGNKIGRMKKKGFTLTDLNKLVAKYEESHDQTLLKHYIERLFENDKLLENYIEKNVPTKSLSEVEHKVPDVVEVVHYIQQGPPPEIKEKPIGNSSTNKKQNTDTI